MKDELVLKVQLSKQPSKTLQDILLRDESYFRRAKIDLVLGGDVTNIHWSTKSLSYKTRGNHLKSIQYDYLVLATGLRPRQLPSSLSGHNLRNIFYLRSVDDANNLVSKFFSIIET